MGLSAALATAARSLEVFSAGIQVAGQNIANASTPGYIREKLVLTENQPYRQGNLVFGTGVLVSGIRQQLDKYLETRLNVASSEASGTSVRNSIYKQLEVTIQELSGSDLSTGLNAFLSSLEEVANQPELLANRQIAVRQGEQFASSVVAMRGRVDDLRSSLNTQVSNLVTEANQLIEQIAKLNPQIVATESAGLLQSDAGGLRTQRYQAIQRLSEIIPIKAIENSTTGVDIFLGSDYLLLSNQVQKLETIYEVDHGEQVLNVRVDGSNTPLTGTQGELAGIISGRDEILGKFIDDLDLYVGTIIHEFNKLHSGGEGLQGFTKVTGTQSATSTTSPLNHAGLPFAPQHGSFDIKVVNQQTGIIETSTIAIDLDGIGTETSLADLQAALSGIPNVTASLTTDRKLVIQSAAGYEIRFANDTSGVLASLGINTFFKGSDSSTLGVNDALAANAGLLAAGLGGGLSDGSNVLRLSQFATKPLAALGNVSLSQHYDTLVSQIGQQSAAEQALSDGFAAFRGALESQRSQYSGVSLDEEAIRVLEYQKSYQAAARIVSVIDELYRTLLQA